MAALDVEILQLQQLQQMRLYRDNKNNDNSHYDDAGLLFNGKGINIEYTVKSNKYGYQK